MHRAASGSRSCSTPARSRSWTRSCATARIDFDMQKQPPLGRRGRHRPRHDRRAARSASSRQDFTVFGGSLGEVMAEKMCKVMDLAAKIGCPVIGINDSGGARIQEGVVSLGAYGDVFLRNVKCSGVIPQIIADHGPVRGRRGLLARDHRLHLHGEGVLAHVHHRPRRHQDGRPARRSTFEELGGAMTHTTKSGVAHFAAEDEEQPASRTRATSCGFLPQNNLEVPPRVAADRRPEPPWTRSSTRSFPTTRTSRTTCATSSGWSSTTASSSRCTSTSPRTSSAASRAWTASRSASSATSRLASAGVLDIDASEPRPRASCAPATPSTSRS